MKNFFKKLMSSKSQSKYFSETVQRVGKNNAGFSLVELIVVIAIMAILAAVAVIGVSIYIPKAQEATDNELMGVLTDALVAACLSEGVDQREITATIAVEADGKLAMKDGKIDIKIGNTSKKDAIANLFNDVVTDKNAKFNLVASKTLVFKNGKFEVSDSVILGVTNGDKTYYYEADSDKANAFANSIFMNGMGIDTTLGIMANVGSFAQDFLNDGGNSDALQAVLTSMEFSKAYAKYAGYPNTINTDADVEAFYEWLSVHYSEEEQLKMTSNALMLYSSEKSNELTTDSVKELLGSDGAKNKILGTMESDTAAAMSQTAAAYGLYTAFLYSQPETYEKNGVKRDDLIKKAQEDPISVLNGLDDEDFQNYIKNSSDADIEGYLAAMDMMNEASGTSNGQGGTAAGDILQEGFDNDWLAELIGQATDK